MSEPLGRVAARIEAFWHTWLRPRWRKVRAGTLRRLGLMPPPGAEPTAYWREGAFTEADLTHSSLQVDPDAMRVWQWLAALPPGTTRREDRPQSDGQEEATNALSTDRAQLKRFMRRIGERSS